MLLRPHDEPVDEDQVEAFLARHTFGQLVAPGRGRDLPVVVPSHYARRDGVLRMHFARANPVWAALEERPRAAFTIVGDYTYIPTAWNAGEEAPPEWGVPTSYYATVQFEGDVRIVDEPAALAALLEEQLAALQPEGGHERVRAGDNPYARQFGAIRGLELHVTRRLAKFKYGGNRPAEHRTRVAERWAARDGPHDAEARAHVERTLRARRDL